MNMKFPKDTIRILHALADELEGGFAGYVYGGGDRCIEIPAADARRVLARYENWRKRFAKLNTIPRKGAQ